MAVVNQQDPMEFMRCDGCGRDMDIRKEQFFKQRTYGHDETYCKACSKQYDKYLDMARDTYEAIDKEKRDKIRSLRKQVFMTPEAAKEYSQNQPSSPRPTDIPRPTPSPVRMNAGQVAVAPVAQVSPEAQAAQMAAQLVGTFGGRPDGVEAVGRI
jgi:hypothetical protein